MYDVPTSSRRCDDSTSRSTNSSRETSKDWILDQRGNGRGHFLIAYVMLSRLFDRPLVPPQQHYLVLGDEVGGLDIARAATG